MFNPWVGKIPWRREWQPTPVFMPGKSHGPRSLVGYSPWGRKESDTGSDGNESAWNAGDLGSIPGLGRSSGEGNGQPTPVFMPGESHGPRSLVGYSPWGCKESDTTERPHCPGCCAKLLQLCLCDPMDCSLPVSPVYI